MPPSGGPPAGWPPRGARRRRSPLATLVSVLGVLGAIVLAVGVTLLVTGEIRDLAAADRPSASSAGRSDAGAGGAAPPTADASELTAALEGAHDGIAVDWSAPGGSGEGLDAGVEVTDAPGVLLVDTVLGSMMGTGTGIVLSADGLAVTNYHVVEDSSRVFVTVADTGERHAATVLGRDAQHDIAVLDVDGVDDLEVASVSTGPLRRGAEVAAVGNGSGQGFLTAVRGEVLGTGRSIMAATEGTDDYARLTGLVQTDADVVPGYSGGPLVDADGQVVAVTVAASDGTTAQDVDGYAIPLPVALSVVEQVLSGEETDTVSIGADGALGIVVASAPEGVSVLEVAPDSAGAGIGLVPGDLILAIDGQDVGGDASAMSRLVNDHNVGARITVTWQTAGGEEREAEAVLQEALVH